MAIARRKFLIGLGGAAFAWPIAVAAQQPATMKRVGVLLNFAATQPIGQSELAAFIERLRQLGWSEGRNIRIEVRWSAGDAELAKIFAAQLIGLMPDVILAVSSTNLTMFRQLTSTVPIVFVAVTDPVEQGFVASLRRPGGNITGFSNFEPSIGGKWLELLKELAPNLARVGVLLNPDTSPQLKFYMQAIEAAGNSLGAKVGVLAVHTPAQIERALARFAAEPDGGLILPGNTLTTDQFPLIAELAGRHRLPSISNVGQFANTGGLMSYYVNAIDDYRAAAGYVDRILKGEKPSELPVQFPARIRLVINIKTAKAIGLTVPPTLLARADEVVE
jgi:putative ABC transport system substrate-binding protein